MASVAWLCAGVSKQIRVKYSMTSTVNPLIALHEKLCSEARALMQAKNHDYTSGSGDPLANFRGATYLGINPVLGIQLRQQDKMMRIRTFVEKGELKVKGESVKDAIIDQINYLVLQYAYIEEQTNETTHAE